MEQQEKIIKKPPPIFLKIDLVIQNVLGILILLTLVVYPVAMLLLIPFGAWQVFSGIIGMIYGSKWRMIYLGIVMAYFSTYSLSELLGNRSGVYAGLEFTLMAIYIVTPIVLGMGYYVKTIKETWKKEIRKPKWQDMEDILDVDMTKGGG